MARRALRAPGEDTALSCTRTAGGSSIRVEVGPLSEPGGSGDDVSEPASPRRLGNRRCASGPRGGRGLRQPRGIRIGPDGPRAQVRTGMRTRERQCNNAMQLTMGRLTVAPTLRRARGLFRTSGAAPEHTYASLPARRGRKRVPSTKGNINDPASVERASRSSRSGTNAVTRSAARARTVRGGRRADAALGAEQRSLSTRTITAGTTTEAP
jgi:hypothetical protein